MQANEDYVKQLYHSEFVGAIAATHDLLETLNRVANGDCSKVLDEKAIKQVARDYRRLCGIFNRFMLSYDWLSVRETEAACEKLFSELASNYSDFVKDYSLDEILRGKASIDFSMKHVCLPWPKGKS